MSFQLRWPVQSPNITQQFGEHPENYAMYGLPGHEGIDFQADNGSPVFAAADGVVSDVRLDGNVDPLRKPYGNQVRIQHDGGFTTVYAHLAQPLVSIGQTVHGGQEIGLADTTGRATGPHLHLTLIKQGATQVHLTNYPYDIVDPNPYLLPYGSTGGTTPSGIQVQVNSPQVGYLNIRNAPSIGAGLLEQVPDGATDQPGVV